MMSPSELDSLIEQVKRSNRVLAMTADTSPDAINMLAERIIDLEAEVEMLKNEAANNETK